MKCLLVSLVFLAWLCGCGAMQQQPQQQPGVQAQAVQADIKPESSLIRTPYVLIVGDDQVTSWGIPAIQVTHPMWTFAGPPVGTQETSGSVLARLPALLKVRHYDVVVLLTGAEDIGNNSDWNAPCGYSAAQPLARTCAALSQMVTLAHAEDSKVLISTIPYTDDQATIPIARVRLNKMLFNFELTHGPPGVAPPDPLGQDGIDDIQAALAGTTWSDDDVLFNASGALAATSTTQAAIGKLAGNWGNK